MAVTKPKAEKLDGERKGSSSLSRSSPAGLLPQQLKTVSHCFRLLSDPTRMQILWILEGGGQHIDALCSRLGQPQPTVSHHLALLRHENILTPKHEGNRNYYNLTAIGTGLIQALRSLDFAPKAERLSSHEGLTPEHQQSILEELQGLVDDPDDWLRTPNAVFENRRPVDLIDTPDEPRLRNRIQAAKMGMFS
jgi:DNA-binding transcriptional ArsR family regulator